MRIVRFLHEGRPRYGLVDGDDVAEVRGLLDLTPTGARTPLATARLLAPVEPRTVVGMAHNTGPADRELPPQAFFKPASSVVGPGAAIPLPVGVGRVDPEAELAVVVGQRCRNLRAQDALDVVLGWTIGNDVTGRDLQRTDPLWVRAKGFDAFTPLGPWIETRPAGQDLPEVELDLVVNGTLVSRATTRDLARDVVEILVYVTSFMTLDVGDVLLTGAPGASAALADGDVVTIRAAGLGELTNTAVTDRGALHPVPDAPAAVAAAA